MGMWNGAELLRRKRARGEFVKGFAVTLPAPELSEMAACAGYDFILIDAEHPPLDRRIILDHVMAAQGAGAAALIRVPGIAPAALKSILDLGPDGIIFPMIHSAEDARLAVAACSYPDQYGGGLRGQGPMRAVRWGFGDTAGYLSAPEQYLLHIMQIESWEGWRNLDEILSVPGVDGVYIGPADLGRSLSAHSPDLPPELSEVYDDVCRGVRARGKWMGAPLSCAPGAISEARRRGVQWGVCGIDAELLAAGMRSCLDRLKGM